MVSTKGTFGYVIKLYFYVRVYVPPMPNTFHHARKSNVQNCVKLDGLDTMMTDPTSANYRKNLTICDPPLYIATIINRYTI